MDTTLYLRAYSRGTESESRRWFNHPLLLAAIVVIAIIALGVITVLLAGSEGPGVLIGAFLMIAISGFIYFLPTIIAVRRKHRNDVGVLLVNLFFGWTLIGWVGALIWSTLDQQANAANR
jgi:hypothetical protein